MRDEKGKFIKGGKRPKEYSEKQAESIRGNTHAVKLPTHDLKEDAYRQYCEHIAQGKSKESWYFINPDNPFKSLTFKTMEKYIKEFPNEFPIIQKEIAEAKSLEVWEEKGRNMVDGKQDKCQPAIYQMFMRNKFGWDKQQEVSHTFEPEARRLLDKWEKSE